jgi:hypothetical protein
MAPVIDCARRNYHADVQGLLEMMLQRDPKKRKDLQNICNARIVSGIYKDLCREEKEFALNI